MALYNEADTVQILQDITVLKNKKLKKDEDDIKILPTLKKIFTTPKTAVSVISFCLMKIGFNIFYTGVQNSMERFGFSFGVSLSIVGFS